MATNIYVIGEYSYETVGLQHIKWFYPQLWWVIYDSAQYIGLLQIMRVGILLIDGGGNN